MDNILKKKSKVDNSVLPFKFRDKKNTSQCVSDTAQILI